MARKFSRLTRTAIRGLTAPSEISEHGVTFKRLANGDGRYSINVMVDGVRIHRVVGFESDGATRSQAETFIESARTDSRTDRLSLPRGRKTALRFDQAAQQYLKRLKDSGGKGLREKTIHLDLHLAPFFKSKPLSGITTFDVERYKKGRLKECGKPATVNRDLSTLRHLLGKAVDWKWLPALTVKVSKLKEGSGRIVYLTADQAEKLLAAARTDTSFSIHAFIQIGLETSMRRMEILSIRIEHVDLDRRVIYIHKAKSGAREQPITENLTHYLRKRMSALGPDQEWLFPSKRSARGHTVSIEKAFRRVVTAAGLDPTQVVRHTLRHTAITHLVQSGVYLPTVKRIAGHSDIKITEKYAHQNSAHIQAAMDKLEGRYRGK